MVVQMKSKSALPKKFKLAIAPFGPIALGRSG
jgi:hypothetical protein